MPKVFRKTYEPALKAWVEDKHKELETSVEAMDPVTALRRAPTMKRESTCVGNTSVSTVRIPREGALGSGHASPAVALRWRTSRVETMTAMIASLHGAGGNTKVIHLPVARRPNETIPH